MKKKKKERRSRLRKVSYPVSVALVMGACAYILLPGFRDLERVRQDAARLRRLEGVRESRNQALKREIASMKTSEGIERAARRHLRLAKPDEVIVVFQSPGEEVSTER
jgi:cell division protein FtsB